MSLPFEVERAALCWTDESTPLAIRFGDTYFSRGEGIGESAYIFIERNGIAERVRTSPRLTVAELGFGTGLNFLLTWRIWRENRTADSVLDYVSCERYPLTFEDLQRALSQWPELRELSQELLRSYKSLVPGFVRFAFDQGRVLLTLLIGDAHSLLPELDTPVDAWFLDGFAPSKNPELWSPSIFAQLGRLSHSNTSYSSFTAASKVRQGLKDAGFSVEKIPGYGQKRESICGTFQGSQKRRSLLPPWKALPPYSGSHRDVLVIGGGLAGFGAAAALCARGHSVTIIEASSDGLGGASGNPAGIFTPYIARERSNTTSLYLSSFLYSLGKIQFLERLSGETLLYQTGAIQSIYTKRLEQLAESFPQLGFDPSIARLDTYRDKPCIHFPQAGWISPRKLCEQIHAAYRPLLTVKYGICASLISPLSSGWRVETEDGATLDSPAVIIASAQHSSRFQQSSWIPLEPIRGEIIQAQATDESEALDKILMGHGYILPAAQQKHLIGASYAHQRSDTAPDPQDQARLLAQAIDLLPSLKGTQIVSSRVSFRTSTHHRLPYTGPVVKYDSFMETFRELRKGYAEETYSQPEYFDGLYITAGHGSRGLVSTLAAGELLADYIDGTTPLLASSLRGEMNPASFLAKQIYSS